LRFVWFPDVLTQADRLIAVRSLPDGTVVELRQFWNGYDFYTTYVRHRFAPGEIYDEVIDDDGNKIWRARVELKDDENGVDIFIRAEATPTYEYTWEIAPRDFNDSGSFLLVPNDPPLPFRRDDCEIAV
jgi:hypothetical protein